MGLGEVADGIGGAISDGVASISMAPRQAINFAQGIASRAENFVEERTGPAGVAFLRTIASAAEGPLGMLPSAAGTIAQAAMDPIGFVTGIVSRAQNTATSAYETAQGVVETIKSSTLGGVSSLFAAATTGLQFISKGLVSGVSLAVKGISSGFMLGLNAIRFAARALLRFEGNIAKHMIAAVAKRKLEQLRRLHHKLILLIAVSQGLLMSLTHRAFQAARTKAVQLAMKVHTKATNLVTKVMPKVLAVTARVMTAALAANAFVQRGIAAVRPYLFGPAIAIVNRLSNFTQTLAAKATRMHVIFAGIVFPAVLRGYQALETHMWPMLMLGLLKSQQLEASILRTIALRGALGTTFITSIEQALERRIKDASRGLQGAVDSGISAIENAPAGIASAIVEGATAVGQAAAGALETVGKGAAALAHQGAEKVQKATGAPLGKNVGQAALEFGKNVAKSVAQVGTGVLGVGSIVAGAAALAVPKPKSKPKDGDLTGPFFPQKQGQVAVHPEAAHHASDDDRRRAELKKGALVIIHAIDPGFEAHLAAAQSLANQVGQAVIGVFNASGGKQKGVLEKAAEAASHSKDAKFAPYSPDVGGSKAPFAIPTGVGGDLDMMMAQPHLTASQIGRARGLIAAVPDPTRRGDLYEALQAKTQYHSQRVNTTLATADEIKGNPWLRTKVGGSLTAGDIMCNLTSLSMVLETLGIGNPDPVNYPNYPDYLEHVRTANNLPARTNAKGWGGVADKMGAKYKWLGSDVMKGREWWTQNVRPELRGGKAVMSSISGHIVRLQSVSAPGLIIDDPFGRVTLGVDKKGNKGSTKWRYGEGQNTVTGTGANRGEDSVWKWDDVSQQKIPWIASFEKTAPAPVPGGIQRSGDGPMPDDGSKVQAELLKSSEGGFQPSSSVRESLGPHLGFDPGGARLHTGPAAATAASTLGAEAFTIGRDVYFGTGRYQPGSSTGMALIAHELTHVGQQTGRVGNPLQFFSQEGGNAMEQEAQRTAELVLANAGRRSGLNVEQYVTHYQSDSALGAAELNRLQQISVAAIHEAERLLGARSGTLRDLQVDVDLDLTRMSDHEAAAAWGAAIVAAAEAHLHARVGTLAPPAIQRTPTAGHAVDVTQIRAWEAALPIPQIPPPAQPDNRKANLHITVMGERFDEVPYDEGLRAMRMVYRQLRGRVLAGQESHLDLIHIHEDQWIVAGISDFLGSTEIPDLRMWGGPTQFLQRAREAIEARDVARAIEHLQHAEQQILECERRISRYVDRTSAGANTAVEGLQRIRTASAITVGVLAIPATGGSSLGAALIGAGYGGLQEVSGQASEVHAGLRQRVDFAGIAFDTFVGFVMSLCLGKICEFAGSAVLRAAAAPGSRVAVLAGTSARVIGRAVQDIIVGRGSSMFNRILHHVFDRLRGAPVERATVQMPDGSSRTLEGWDLVAHEIARELTNPESYFWDLVSGHAGRYAQARVPRPPQPAPPSGSSAPTTSEAPAASASGSPSPPPEHAAAASAAAAGAETPTQPHEAQAAAAAGASEPPTETAPAQAAAGAAEPPRAPVEATPSTEPPGGPRPPGAPGSTPPGGSLRARVTAEAANFARGGNAALRAGRRLILEARSFRALRELAGQGGLTIEQQTWIDRARAMIVRDMVTELNQRYPELIFEAPGTAGFNSDIDITVRPRNSRSAEPTLRQRRQAGNAGPAPADVVANGIERSRQAVTELNQMMRERLGGEPDTTIDTNNYRWNAADSPIREVANPTAEANRARTIASLAEQHQAAIDNPEAWAEMRRLLLAGAPEPTPEMSPQDQAFRRAQRASIEQALAQAETLSNQHHSERMHLEQQIRSQHPELTVREVEMRAREQLANHYSERLQQAIQRTPPNPAEIAMLQAQLKLVEPGAYASNAGIRDVPGFQQVAGRASTARISPEQRAAIRRLVESGAFLDDPTLANHIMELDPISAPQDIADSAGSTMAQLEVHAGHPPTSVASAMDLIKSVYKYGGRLGHALDFSRTGNGPGVPAELRAGYERSQLPMAALEGASGQPVGSIEGHPREQILSMLGGTDAQRTEAMQLIQGEGARRGVGGTIEQIAQSYADARLSWARQVTATLRTRAMSQAVAGEWAGGNP